MQVLGIIFAALLGIAALFGLVWGGDYFGLIKTGYFAPRYEAIRRDVMIESRAYSEGTVRELYRFKIQYQQAKTDAERATLKAMAMHEFAIYDKARLPADLRAFMEALETSK